MVKAFFKAVIINTELVLLVVIVFILYMFYMYPANSSSTDYEDKFPDFGQAEDEKLEEK
jgi:cbb3-type cytochrome oxidase subunit 3